MSMQFFNVNQAGGGMFVTNAGGTPSIQTGTFAARPVFGTAGRIYIANDTDQIFEDTGAAWALIGSGAVATTIYTGDGALAGVRVVDLGVHSLQFSGTDGPTQSIVVLFDDTPGGAGINLQTRAALNERAALDLQSGGGGTTSFNLFVSNAAGVAKEIFSDPASGGGITVSDAIDLIGLAYGADYSAAGLLFPRWIPDIGTLIAMFVNGLRYDAISKQFKLGGTLIENTLIDLGTAFGLTIADNTNGSANVFIQADLVSPSVELSAFGAAGAGNGGILHVDNIQAFINFDVIGTGSQQITLGGVAVGMVVVDAVNSKGFVNGGDYELNFVARSLVTKQYVDAKIAGSPGIVTKGKLPGILASQNLVTYAIITGTESLFRINGTVNQSAVGTLSLSVTYTDTNSNVTTQILAATAAGGPATNIPVILAYCKAATNISIDIVVTGAAVADAAWAIELLD